MDQFWRILSYLFLACVLVVIAATFLNYGLTWDEDVHRAYGERILNWYASGFQDRSALDFLDLYLYGGWFDALGQLVARISPVGVFETRHFLTAILGFLAIVFIWRLGAHLSGDRAGFFSAIFLTLTPRFYGHMFNNPKDIPFATFFLISIYYLIITYRSLPRISKGSLIKLGIALGLAIGVRVGGVILVFGLALLWFVWILANARFRERGKLKFLFRSFLIAVGVAWLVMILSWPWAQVNPFLNPVKALKATTNFDWPYTVFFRGRYIQAANVPWDYLPTWFLITLPEFYYVALFAGFSRLLFRSARAQLIECEFETKMKVGFLIFICFIPVLSAILLRSTLYDGLRHFLFVIPILSVLSGISFDAFLKSNFKRITKTTLSVLICFSLFLTFTDMRELYPYEAVYFNRFVGGGLKKASLRYETDYWGSSYREGAEWLIRNYSSNKGEPIRVASCSPKFLVRYFLEKTEELQRRFVMVESSNSPDIFFATTRWDCHKEMKGKVIHQVMRQKTPLLYVIELGS